MSSWELPCLKKVVEVRAVTESIVKVVGSTLPLKESERVSESVETEAEARLVP